MIKAIRSIPVFMGALLRVSVVFGVFGVFGGSVAWAQQNVEDVARLAQPPASKKSWTDRLSIRGYSQLRYTFPKTDLVNENDRSVGQNTNFILRRGRVVISGEASDLLSIYIQPDFGVTVGDSTYIAQLRDFYGDVFFDAAKHYRIRAGLSKVPYGFENVQSSQNRVAFDRADALNTAVKDERDLGLFLYWETPSVRARFKELIDKGLKGSGDYGIFALGVYNGQGLARRESNNNLHVVTRFSYPMELASGQFFEPGISAYTGLVDVSKSTGVAGGPSFRDQRIATHLIWYPQPLGLQLEYNYGEGPEQSGTAVTSEKLHGGYVQAMYKIDHFLGEAMTPYTRIQYYDGGRKLETNAARNRIREAELGVEWQVSKAVELTAAYSWSQRNVTGSVVRTQLQLNY